MKKIFIKDKSSLFMAIKIVVMLAIIILGVFDVLHVIDITPCTGAFALIAATVLSWTVATVILRKKSSRTLRFFRKAIAAAMLLELTVFQIPSYNMLFGGDYTVKTVYPADAAITADNVTINDEDSSVTVTGKNEAVFDFTDLNQTIGTVKVNLKFGEDTKRTQLKIDMADETHIEPRTDVGYTSIVKGSNDSEYVPCQYSGTVSQMKLRIVGYNDNDLVTIQSFTFNKIIPFHISVVRFAFLSFIGTLCYGIAVSGFLKKPYKHTKKFCLVGVLSVMICSLVIATAMVMVKLPDDGFASRWKLNAGDQITQEIVDAFENKQVNLLAEPTPELMNVENPYDWSMRNDAGAKYEWDHVYYEGKYYSYYGIAPVLTFFLPYHKLTDHYFAADMAVWIFSCIGLIFLGLTYMAIVKRWFRQTPTGCILAGAVIMYCICGIWFSVGRAIFYEIAISSGFMYLTMGAYCLISANVLSDGNISLIRTALSSLFIGLAVLSRPTLAVYAICAFIFYILAMKRSSQLVDIKTRERRQSKSHKIKYIFCAFFPIFTLGLFQMWYNYARFGSAFDFGIKYSLTINDFVHSRFHLIFVIIGLFNYLFAMPGFSTDFPYIKTQFSRFNVNGYYFSDAGNTSGILFLAFPVIGYLFGGKALSRLPDRRAKLYYSTVVGLPCLVMPLVIICSVWQSGYAIRYTADFSWEILIGALAILFFLYRKSRNETKKTMLRAFMGISMMAAVVINAIQIVYFAFPENDYPEICRSLQDIIAFWN